MDTMIIVASLCNKPSEKTAIYWLTTEARYKKHISVLVETDSYAIDIYYRFLRSNGLMDGVEGLILPEEHVEAIRIDKSLDFPNTIVANYIGMKNAPQLLQSVFGLIGIDEQIRHPIRNILY